MGHKDRPLSVALNSPVRVQNKRPPGSACFTPGSYSSLVLRCQQATLLQEPAFDAGAPPHDLGPERHRWLRPSRFRARDRRCGAACDSSQPSQKSRAGSCVSMKPVLCSVRKGRRCVTLTIQRRSAHSQVTISQALLSRGFTLRINYFVFRRRL